jgi:tricorn protease
MLLTIDCISVTPTVSVPRLLAGKAGRKIQLRIAHGDSVFTAEIKGVGWYQNYHWMYDQKVADRAEFVGKMSKGRIGYAHIEGMDNPSYDRFLDDLFAKNFDKEALIIDVRGNGGGYLHDRLIETLTRKTYAYESNRTFQSERKKSPGNTWEKPMVVLIDEDSFSDAEIFPAIFQELKMGKVIGMPTSGSVIGTGEVDFMDGSSMRMPSDGWFLLSGKNLEGNGVQPDIRVEMTPEQILHRDDVQLRAGVDELLRELNGK